jgi:PAS domain S-box-containing protein
VNREECSERIRLVDQYSQSITDFNNLLEFLKSPSRDLSEEVWNAAETARAESQIAWDSLAAHIAEHKCIDVPQPSPDLHRASGSGSVMEKAALAAVDVILVADDDLRYVDVNEAAADAFGLRRSEVVGRRIDEFFATADGGTIREAWNDFVAEGVKRGICQMNAAGRRRRFEFSARANFAPGLHMSVMREVNEDVKS